MTGKKQLAVPQTAEPLNLDAKVYGDLMNKFYRLAKAQGHTCAESAQEFFGFHYNHVVGLYYQRNGHHSGFFFCLHDGRVFDEQARPHDPDASGYDKTTH
jgi:hypothetical protein